MHMAIFPLLVAQVFFIGFLTISQAMAEAPEQLRIVSPVMHQTLYEDSLEIYVLLGKGADPAEFKAWLNGREITDRFESVEGGVRALVDIDDGLRAYTEKINTIRDEKGIWFIQGEIKHPSRKRGANHFRARIGNLERRSSLKKCVFFVDTSLHNAFEAMGYAVATDRLWQSELYRRSARGSLAEVFGPDMLETDIFMRIIGYSKEELETGFEALNSKERAIIKGYTAGFNRRISEIRSDPSRLPFEFIALGYSPEDWSEQDVLAWFALLQRNFDPEAMDQDQINNGTLLQYLMQNYPDQYMDMFEDLRWVNDPAAQTYIVPRETPIPGARLQKYIDKDVLSSVDFKKVSVRMMSLREKVRKSFRKINAHVKMGSYAWVVSGNKTASGNPILYSGPQMGFPVPSVVTEGAIRAAGLHVSGMTVPGVPGIIIGRTPHHTWSMQVGHAHTTDYYFESPDEVFLHRLEVIRVAGGDDVILPVYRTDRGPVVNPIPYDPSAYTPDPSDPIISWRYAHWGHEFNLAGALLKMCYAGSMDEFGHGVDLIAVSQHFCYADRSGNIAYWMSGRDPVRPADGEYRLPQGLLGPALDWDDEILKPRSHDRNPDRGFFGGWNNKTSQGYAAGFNSNDDIYGPFHRAHVIESYLKNGQCLTFDALRDLALDIAVTDSFQGAGNPWVFVADDFTAAVMAAGLTAQRELALKTLEDWDGHFVSGGPVSWVTGKYRAGAWVLMDAWLREVIRLTFEDELPKDLDENGHWKETFMGSDQALLFNVILHALRTEDCGIVNNYDWFSNLLDPDAPQCAEDIIVGALDTVMEGFGGVIPEYTPRGHIVYMHGILGEVWRTPYAFRSTYAQIVEMGRRGPVRIESMFPLGQSGNILVGENSQPVFDPNFFSMAPIYDVFEPRLFPFFSHPGRKGNKGLAQK